MKIIIYALLLAAAAAGACSLDLKGLFSRRADGGPGPGGGYPSNISPEEARDFIRDRKPVVIDIRTAQEHAAARIEPTHVTLDYYAADFREKLEALDRNAEYLLYCRSGNRTGHALRMMKDLGFTRVRHIDGGINAWTRAGLPVAR